MNLKITASTLFLYLILFSLQAQNGDPCYRDYSLLNYPIRIELGELRQGQSLYLSDEYIKNLAAGNFDNKKSEVKFFEYLRPATKKEIKQGSSDEETYERVFGDNNIYSLNELPSQFHFFSPRPGFEGSLAGTWEDPYLLLPMGLEPVHSKTLTGVLLTIVESTSDYLLLEGAGSSFVYYPGYPEVSDVFISADAALQIESRQGMAESFVGNRFFLENHPSLRFRKTRQGKDLSLPETSPGLEVEVNAAYSYPNEILLRCNNPEPIFVLIDEFTQFKLYDLDCLETQNRDRWATYEDEASHSNKELNAMIQADTSVTDLFENEWVLEQLKSRFRLYQELGAEKAEYQCLYLQDDDEHVKSYLIAHVDQDGEIYLQSQYSSERGLYHTKIKLLVEGTESGVSDRIRALDPRNMRSRIQDRVIEKIHFKGGADNGMLEIIARNCEREITVQFVAGGSYVEDIILLPKYKDAIRDAWLLSQYLKNQEELHLRIRGEK